MDNCHVAIVTDLLNGGRNDPFNLIVLKVDHAAADGHLALFDKRANFLAGAHQFIHAKAGVLLDALFQQLILGAIRIIFSCSLNCETNFPN